MTNLVVVIQGWSLMEARYELFSVSITFISTGSMKFAPKLTKIVGKTKLIICPNSVMRTLHRKKSVRFDYLQEYAASDVLFLCLFFQTGESNFDGLNG